jgi:UDP-N-acetylglucosamine acyltransferase
MRHFTDSNCIAESAIVHPSTKIGSGNYIGPFCVIHAGVQIGSGNVFMSHVSVGAPAEHKSFAQSPYAYSEEIKTVIGDNNTFREFMTIHTGTERETFIGNKCFAMARSHISHDNILEDNVTLCTAAQLGGHTYVMKGATIGLGSQIHQYQVIGSYAMLGMGAIVPPKASIYPGRKFVGNPVRDIGVNKIGLERAGYTVEEKLHFHVPIEEDRYHQICKLNWGGK